MQIRPTFSNILCNYGRGAAVGRVDLAIGAAVLIFLVAKGVGSLWIPLVVGLIVGIAFLVCVAYTGLVRIQVDDDRVIIRHGRLWTHRVMDRTELGRIALFEVRQEAVLPGSKGGTPTYKVLFLDKGERLLHRLSGWAWSPEGLAPLGTALDVAVDGKWNEVEAGELSDAIPGSVPWFEALSTGAKLIVLVPVIVMLVLVFAAWRP